MIEEEEKERIGPGQVTDLIKKTKTNHKYYLNTRITHWKQEKAKQTSYHRRLHLTFILLKASILNPQKQGF